MELATLYRIGVNLPVPVTSPARAGDPATARKMIIEALAFFIVFSPFEWVIEDAAQGVRALLC
jgi:hypothetical protein